MAGGHIVVSTLGTTITGATGLRVVNAYVNEHKSFGVEKKRDGTGVSADVFWYRFSGIGYR
ncbi:hypothetical protein [Corynebacterium cystitidis]|uniref:hypothetical protein n=1 Tax=Corynebacterium cystitidis TaxID=35757 RepID=UPI00211DF6D3|nr:hypothetical protein [Corynebacterium cystitidis]